MIRTVLCLAFLVVLLGCESTAVPMEGGQSVGTAYSTDTEHQIGPPEAPTKLTVSDRG